MSFNGGDRKVGTVSINRMNVSRQKEFARPSGVIWISGTAQASYADVKIAWRDETDGHTPSPGHPSGSMSVIEVPEVVEDAGLLSCGPVSLSMIT